MMLLFLMRIYMVCMLTDNWLHGTTNNLIKYVFYGLKKMFLRNLKFKNIVHSTRFILQKVLQYIPSSKVMCSQM